MQKENFEKYFIKELIYGLERNDKFEIQVMNQQELKIFFEDNYEEYSDCFPMICFEYTDDSPNDEVNFEESKFLNDDEHDGTWLLGYQHGEVVFIMCLINDNDELEIDTFEVSKQYRGNKFGSYIVDEIEYIASDYFDKVYISPFDTNALNFWKKQGYKGISGGYYVKKFDEFDEY